LKVKQELREETQLKRFCPYYGWKNAVNESAVLLKPREFCFCLLIDGRARVGIFPEGEKAIVGGQSPDAGGIGLSTM
jgi:hypothetical protein